MRALIESVWFRLCLTVGALIRAGTYSSVRTPDDEALSVRKRRRFHAPLLVWLGGPLVRLLDTGVTVLPQSDWEVREREMYRDLYGTSIRIDDDGTLVLPHLHGETLATLLDSSTDPSIRMRAIELATVALASFHARGYTHGDAMAENVMVDLQAGIARWFDFETVHDASRTVAWRRADDVRALLVTCLLRTRRNAFAQTLRLILDVYADDEVTRHLATLLSPVLRRPLPFHLGQAALTLNDYREIDRLLTERITTR